MFLCRVHLPPPVHFHTEKRCLPYHRDKKLRTLQRACTRHKVQWYTGAHVFSSSRDTAGVDADDAAIKSIRHTPEYNGTNLGGVVVRTAGEQVAAGVPLDGVDFIRMS